MRQGLCCIAICLGLAWSASAAAQQDAGISRLVRAIASQEELNADLQLATPRATQEALQEAAQLDEDERNLDGAVVTMSGLRQARFDADTRRTRLAGVEDRAEFFAGEVRALDREIAVLAQQPPPPQDSLEAYAAKLRMSRLRQLRDRVQETVDLYRKSAAAIAGQLDTLNQRLALLQARVRLGAVDEAAELDADPRARALREFVVRTGRESVRLANEASGVEPRSEADSLRKRQIELQADTAFLRSNLRAADIDLLGVDKQLAYLKGIAATERGILPRRLATEGVAAVRRLESRLDARTTAIAGMRRSLDDQRSLLPRPTPATAQVIGTMRAMIDDLNSTVDGQEAAVAGSRQSAEATLADFQRLEAAAADETLLARNLLPANLEAWERIGRSAIRVPAQLVTSFVTAGQDIRTKLAIASRDQLALAAAAVLGLLLAALLLRYLLHSRLIADQPETALATPAAAIRDSILTLVPAAAWWAVAYLLGLTRDTFLLVGGLLAIWPAVAFVLLLARRVLFRDAREGLEVRQRFYRSLRWTLVLGGILGALVILTSTLPLSPALSDLVSRSAMLCVLLIALPGLQLRSLILALAGGRKKARLVWRMTARASRLVPILLAGAAAIGLAGYLNLAWVIIAHLLWLILIGGLLLLCLGVLGDVRLSLRRQIGERFPDNSYFWILNFLDPAYRLLQLLAVLAAGWALLRIYGWDATTPGIRELLAFGRTPVLTLGQSSLDVENIFMAVVLVGLVFWIGGWSQQVSYNLALTRVRDLGIRQSLSTFVQYIVIVLGLLLTLKVIGLDLTALTVFAASVGVGIGFGMQNVVNNFISGVLLLAERPLRVTDVVTIGGETGEVTRIGIRSLIVRTFDRKDLVIPNSAVIGNTFTNWTRNDETLREVLLFRISYRDDPRRVATRIEEIARAAKGVAANPAPKATVYEFQEAAVIIRLQYYARLRGAVGGLDIRAEILTAVRDHFAEAGIAIPTPTGDVTLPRAPVPPALTAGG